MAFPFTQQLAEAEPAQRARLIAARPATVGEAEVHELAEQARAAARGNPSASLHMAESAAALAEALGQPRGQALASRARGVALWAHARWTEAAEAFDNGVRHAESCPDPLLAAQIPILKIDVLAQLGRYEEAIQLAEHLGEALRLAGAEMDAAKVDANAGNIYYQREEYAAAHRCWQRALAFFEAQGNPGAVASLQVNIANVLSHLNRVAEARAMWEAAMPVLQSAGAEVVVAGIEGNLAYLDFKSGRYTEALQSFARARSRFEKLSLPKDLALCDRKLGDVYLELNLIPEAREAFERVLPQFRELGMTGEVGRSELGLAFALAADERMPAALEALDRAEAAFRECGNEIAAFRTRLRREEWRFAHAPSEEVRAVAHREARAALKVFRRYGNTVDALQARYLLAILRMDACEQPVRSLSALRRDAEREGYAALIWQVDAALARVVLRAGREQSALRHYRRAVESIERLRVMLHGDDYRIAFLRDKVRVYEELLSLLLDRGTPAALREAFELAERSRSRTLLERIAQPVRESASHPERAAMLRRLEELRAQLTWDYSRLQQTDDHSARLPHDAALPQRVRDLEQEYLQAERQLQLFTSGAGEISPVTGASDLESLLGPDERLVEYVTAGDEVLAFVVGGGRLETVRGLASVREVEEEAARLRYQWSKFGPGGLRAEEHPQVLAAATRALRTLYEMLLEPLEPLLDVPRLTLVPTGVLHGLPFHAFAGADGWAGDRWEMIYAPSAAVSRACRLRPEPQAESSLLVGYSGDDLPHVSREIAALRELLPDASVFEEQDAALEVVPRSGAYRFVHFATHAVFRRDNPLFSGLRLADGWLIAHDLFHRRLECSLATLSACRTGMSLVAAGDEVLGLARGFLYGGARAVMVSLWAADDRATAELMRHCYGGLAEGLSRAAALRRAQQWVRERYPHPYYWAPFSLTGAR